MYRVFEALDELVTIVEEARGVPMTASCVVPRGDVLELLDDVRDALPGEVDDAQDVLDHRDQMIGEATETAAQDGRATPQAEAHRLVSTAHADAEATVTGARAEADRLVREADRARRVARRQGPGRRRPDRAVRSGAARRAAGQGAMPRPSGRSPPAGPATRARWPTAGPSRPGWSRRPRWCRPPTPNRPASWTARTPTPTGCGRSATATSTPPWASLEETLTTTLRTIGRGRTALRSGGVADFRD